MKKVQHSHVQPAMNRWQPPPTFSLAGRHSTTFGSILRQQRLAQGLSRALLASRAGLGESALEKIELNQAPPSYEDIKNLARVLHVPKLPLMQAAGYVKRGQGQTPEQDSLGEVTARRRRHRRGGSDAAEAGSTVPLRKRTRRPIEEMKRAGE